MSVEFPTRLRPDCERRRERSQRQQDERHIDEFEERTDAARDYVARYTDGLGFDIVYDTVGGPTLEQSAMVTRLYGRLVTCAAWGQHDLAPVLGRHGVILRKIAALVNEGKLSPVVDPVRFQLADTAAVHGRLDSGQAGGSRH